MKIEDARVLITGGSSGIGRETARLLIERGARVAICGRRVEPLTRVAAELGALAIPADVSVEADVVRLVRGVIDALEDYNVLINNAAFGYFSDLADIDLGGFTAMMATNLTGAMLVARESVRHFIPRRQGHIVNIGSTAAHRGFAGGTAYCASKFGLTAMTECWRAELRKHGIRVMQINPSEVMTGFAEAAGFQQMPSERKLRTEEIAHTIVGCLEMDDRGFVTDATIWATNPD